MRLRFYVLEGSYRIIDDSPVIQLFGRTEKGERICVTQENFEPYFWILNAKPKEIEGISVKQRDREIGVLKIETHKKSYLGKESNALKAFVKLPADVAVLREELKNSFRVLEADIPYIKRYFIDKKITPLTLCEAEGEFTNQSGKTAFFRAEKVEQISDDTLKPKILAFDIETNHKKGNMSIPEEDPIIMIGLKGENFEKVITWKRFRTSLEYVEFVNSEAALINRFKEVIEEQKPDIIAGYYSDEFDFPYIKTRADKYKISLDLGLDNSSINYGKGRKSSAQITGIAHIDAFRFISRIISRSLSTGNYDLNSIASEMLGEAKTDFDFEKLPEIWESSSEELEDFCRYNMQDANLTLKLTQKILPSITELVKIVGQPMFDIARMSFSQLVEWYLIRRAQEFDELIPNKPGHSETGKRQMQSYIGGFVYEPSPGLYKDIAVFDFRSLYPSIISTHNISPDTLNCDCCPESEKAPAEQSWFCQKKKGFIAAVIDDIIKRRRRIKEMMKATDKTPDKMLNARQEALKTIANAMYGYMGFFMSRWYSLPCVKSITAYGRKYIQDVINEAKKQKFKVLYADSLPYERNVFIKLSNGDIKLIKIGELYERHRQTPDLSTLALSDDGKVVFRPIKRVICHSYKGELVGIKTKYGSTVVTPQHAVYSFNCNTRKICLVDAKKLKSGDKLISLTNPQFTATYKKNHILDVAELDLGEFSNEVLLYRDNKSFPAKKGICPYCKKKVILHSHVFSKHPKRKHKLNKESEYRWLGALHGKGRKIPRYWKMDEDLAWLLGMYCADGSVSDVATKSGRKAIVSFGSQNKKIIKKVKSILYKKIGPRQEIIKSHDNRTNRNMFYCRVQSLSLTAMLQYGFGAGKGSEFKKVPWFIFTADETLRRAFIKGYLDGDGNSAKDKRYTTRFIRFSTKSKELACGLDFLLKSLKHTPNAFGKEMKHVAWLYRSDKPKIQSLRLQSARESQKNFCLAEIKSTKKLPGKKYVYDLEVEGAHNFVDAEGMILVHNTDSIFLVLEKKTKEQTKEFIEKINLNLPGLMELEYEGFYPAGIFVSLKEKGKGAKKKYALVDEKNVMKVRGFETVRRNTSQISKETQEKILKIILKEQNKEKAAEYLMQTIEKLRKKQVPLSKVIINTQLQKELASYDAIAPHVAIARKMRAMGKPVAAGSTIKFVVVQGKDKIRDRARLPEEVKEDEYDPEYYINNQILPAVEKIFEVIGINIKEMLEGKDQSKLQRFLK